MMASASAASRDHANDSQASSEDEEQSILLADYDQDSQDLNVQWHRSPLVP